MTRTKRISALALLLTAIMLFSAILAACGNTSTKNDSAKQTESKKAGSIADTETAAEPETAAESETAAKPETTAAQSDSVKEDDPAGLALTPEEAVDIYMANKDVWRSEFEMFSGMYGDGYFFWDLDFDGVLELITHLCDGTMRSSWNHYYTIDVDNRTVVELQTDLYLQYGENDGIVTVSDYDFLIYQAETKLLKDPATGQLFYYCGNAQDSGMIIDEKNNRSAVFNYGKLYLNDNVIYEDTLFGSSWLYNGNERADAHYSYNDGNESIEVSEEEYNRKIDDYLNENTDLNLTFSIIRFDNFRSASDAEQRTLLLDAYRAFSYDGFSFD